MSEQAWAIVPAAGQGVRFGGDVPKQYLRAAGQPLLAHALDAVLADARVAGVVVALAEDDSRWPGWTTRNGKPVIACVGGAERADSVLAALDALPADVAGDSTMIAAGATFGGQVAATEPRDGLWRAFTPQAVRRDLLHDALARARADGIVATDEAMAVERLGHHPRLVEGRDDNLKVTTPADLDLANHLLAARAAGRSSG